MLLLNRRLARNLFTACLGLQLGAAASWAIAANPSVPGLGTRVAFDDFEDEKWSYEPNSPKSSSNIDHQERQPGGQSNNNLWYESALRGQPDVVKRVPTPPGGLPNSKGSMMLRSLHSGVPDYRSNKFQQDDLVMNASSVTGGYISPGRTPSAIVRVYLPPFEKWEQRTGTSFGVRADVVGTFNKPNEERGFFRRRGGMRKVTEAFWPGFFIQYNGKGPNPGDKPTATILIRADEYGHEIPAKNITEPGWWTFGMSFTPDGLINYYAKPGVGKLTQADYLTSQLAYGTRVENFNTVFLNVVNQDDGRTWSTEWIVDDVEIFVKN